VLHPATANIRSGSSGKKEDRKKEDGPGGIRTEAPIPVFRRVAKFRRERSILSKERGRGGLIKEKSGGGYKEDDKQGRLVVVGEDSLSGLTDYIEVDG